MKIKSTITFLCFGIITFTSYSQVTNTLILDYNNVAALISDGGYLFNNSAMGTASYEVPKGSGKNVIYTSSLWIGALTPNDEPKICVGKYANQDLNSGPIADNSAYGTQDYVNQYSSSIWGVTMEEIDFHVNNYDQGGYIIPASIVDWPGNGDVSLGVAGHLAPYVDVNGDEIYNPELGDYPDIRGDAAVYTIMNDKSYNPSVNSIGIEVHVMAYQYGGNGYLNNATFLSVKVYNRGTTNYHDYKQSIYMDPDIGNYNDDYVGCDSANSIAFAYNGDSMDENSGGNIGYGQDPPAVGIVSLSHDMTTFSYYTGNGGTPGHSDPGSYLEYWNYMNGLWQYGDTMYYGGQGYTGSAGVTNVPTSYAFSGNPYLSSGWTEVTNNNPPGDRRFVMTIEQDEFNIGDVICSDYAIVYDKSGTNYENVNNVINNATSLRTLYNSSAGFPCQGAEFVAVESLSEESFNIDIFPNPSTGSFTIELDEFNNIAEITIVDLTGRKVYQSKTGNTVVNVDLPEERGVYLVRVKTEKADVIQKLIIQD